MSNEDRRTEDGRYRPPPHQGLTWGALGALAILVIGLLSVRFSQNPDSPRPGALRPLPPDGALALVPHELESDYWPCSDCHGEEPTNYEVRKLEEDHDDLIFEHGTLWCLDCHVAENRDRIHLANGEAIEFKDSWRLCTQCHGKKLADWEAGVHGKRSGHWRGDKEYVTCVVCHSPHQPRFEPIEPMPKPARPEQIVGPGEVAVASPPSGGEEHHD